MEINRENYEIWFLDYAEGALNTEQVAELMLFVEQHPDLKEELEAFEIIELDTPAQEVYEDKDQLKSLPLQITDQNYEAFFIGWLEGDLTNEQRKAVQSFLDRKPEYEKAFALFQKTRLEADPAIRLTHAEVLHQDITTKPLGAANLEDWLIADMEGDLTIVQKATLTQWLETHPEAAGLKSAFLKTRLQPELIVYTDKDDLKRRRKGIVIPMWTYSAVAAAVVLLLVFSGLFNSTDPITPIGPSVSLSNSTPHSIGHEPKGDSLPVNEGADYAGTNDEDQSPTPDQNATTPSPQTPQFIVNEEPAPVPVEDTALTPTIILPLTPTDDGTGIAQEQSPKDSVFAPQPNDKEDERVAMTTPKESKQPEFLKPLEYAEQVVKKRLFDGEEPVGVLDIAEAVTGNPTDRIAVVNSSNNDRTSFRVSLGGFGFSRSKQKNRP